LSLVASLAGLAGLSLFLFNSTPANGAGKVIPPVTVKNMQGKSVKLSFKGKPSLVVFWATWCGPCRAEIPDLNRLQAKYAKKGLQIRALSVDDGTVAQVRPFVKQLKMKYPVYLSNPPATKRFGNIDAIPASFLLDAKGRVVKEYVGLQDPKVLERDIARVM
jgi:thiol-disulfide isomerase/thioredoxin